MEKISLIVPAYNSEAHLDEMFASVLAQTYTNWEMILMNDGSTDRTKEKALVYAAQDARIHYVEQENQGASVARNEALPHASGEWIAYLDADDVLLPDYLKNLYEAAMREEADVSICAYEKFYNSSGEVFYTRLPSEWDVEFQNGITHCFSYSPCCKLIRRELFTKYDLQFSAGEHLEDGPFSCELLLLSEKTTTIDDVLYRYRTADNTIMGNVRKTNSLPKPPYNAIERTITQVRKYNTDPEKDKVMEFCVIKMMAGLATNMFAKVQKDLRKEICAYCHRIMQTYFPHANKNPYVGIGRLKKLPLTHRAAVAAFIFFDRLNLLYPFSLLAARILR